MPKHTTPTGHVIKCPKPRFAIGQRVIKCGVVEKPLTIMDIHNTSGNRPRYRFKECAGWYSEVRLRKVED